MYNEKPPFLSSRGKMVMVMVMVMVATLTRTTAACPLGQEGRCAEDGVSGVEEREKGGQESGVDERERVCVEWRKGVGVGSGSGSGKWDIGAERVKSERGNYTKEKCAFERVCMKDCLVQSLKTLSQLSIK